MIKRLLFVLFVATLTGACSPVLQRPAASPVVCVMSDAVTETRCSAPALVRRAAVTNQDPTDGPGNKDFGTWMMLLLMGATALYLMAFK